MGTLRHEVCPFLLETPLETSDESAEEFEVRIERVEKSVLGDLTGN